MGLGVEITVNGLEAALSRLARLQEPLKGELLEGLGALGVSQTQRRLASEKTSPQGAAWAPTAEGKGALFRTGAHLYDTMQHVAGGDQVRWGTGWKYAPVHQYGAVIKPKGKALVFTLGGKKVFARKVTIPARPFVGLSAANQLEMIKTAERFIERYVQ
jgi:phage gpG-like protein